MNSTSFLLLLACVFFTCSSAQKSCRGHCGESYKRGDKCHCDFECLSHNECCKNFESVCTTRNSCKGRCGEHFKRGRECHCDIECVKFDQCCPDYETKCTLEEEETDDPEVTTDSSSQSGPDAEDYDPEEEAITEANPLQKAASDSESLAGKVPEEKVMDPTEPVPYPTQVDVETELTNSAKKASEPVETEESSSPLNEELSTPEASIIPTATEAPTGNTDPPVPEQNPESSQNASEPEPLPPNSTALLLPTEVTTMPNSNLSDLPPTTSTVQAAQPNTTTSSEQPEQNSESNLKTTDSSPITALPNNGETADSNSQPAPPSPIGFNPPEETLSPENNPGPQTEQPQPELSENEASGIVEPMNLNPTEKPIATETPKTQENTKDPTTKDQPTTPDTVKEDTSTKEPEKPTKPKPDTKDYIDEGNPQDYQSDANKDTNLCSGRPVNGLTTLRNGTVVVFRGHYFWILDSRRRPGPAQGITDVWGIPSPIDTVFTRCNCQGKTYFFKGNDYWRFENDVMDPGFPKPISEGFGLGGQITAALSMPQYRSRKESVFFFKRGGLAQRYSYRIQPQCGRKASVYTIKKKVKRQAVPELGQEIDIMKNWIGFPSTVSSAISVRTTGGDGYKYYVFSKSKYYSLKMERETPVILTPRAGEGQQKPGKSWFRCPETQ